MGASDYVVVPSPNYQAPPSTFGLQLGQALSNLPDQFMRGRENRRTIEKQDAFKDGMPVRRDANGGGACLPGRFNVCLWIAP